MPKQFEGETCVFCPRPSSPGGEHVWPRWFFEMFPDSEGPYTWFVNGEAVSRRDGRPRSHASIGRVKLPVCEQCNGTLDSRFEKPAKPVIRRLFETKGDVILAAEDATVASAWFLKTWLLLAHPKALDSEPGIAPPRWHSTGGDLWTWMARGLPPPDGLSLWMVRRGDESSNAVSTRHIPLPTVVVDGLEVEFMSKQVGVVFFDLSLVYHPGWEIEHPLEVEGGALRLWPRDRDDPADFASLAAVDPRDVSWLRGPRLQFLSGMFPNADLPPLSTDIDLMMGLAPFLEFAAW